MRPVLPARSRSLLTALLLVVTSFAAVVGPVGSAEARAGYGSYIVLVPGDHGSRVAALQRFLHVRPASGYFGPRTRAAVKRWQGAHHRHRTGLVGKRLWRAVKGSGTAARRAPAPSRSGDRASTLNWRALARCESSGNPRAVNPAGYYGLYQFDLGTWRSVGGSGVPTAASAGEQTYRAKLLYKQRGRSPWPNCGRLL